MAASSIHIESKTASTEVEHSKQLLIHEAAFILICLSKFKYMMYPVLTPVLKHVLNSETYRHIAKPLYKESSTRGSAPKEKKQSSSSSSTTIKVKKKLAKSSEWSIQAGSSVVIPISAENVFSKSAINKIKSYNLTSEAKEESLIKEADRVGTQTGENLKVLLKSLILAGCKISLLPAMRLKHFVGFTESQIQLMITDFKTQVEKILTELMTEMQIERTQIHIEWLDWKKMEEENKDTLENQEKILLSDSQLTFAINQTLEERESHEERDLPVAVSSKPKKEPEPTLVVTSSSDLPLDTTGIVRPLSPKPDLLRNPALTLFTAFCDSFLSNKDISADHKEAALSYFWKRYKLSSPSTTVTLSARC